MHKYLQKVQAYIESKNPEAAPITDSTDIFDNGLIDSLQFLDYMLYIEEVANVKINVSTINIDDFRSLSALSRYLSEIHALNNTSEMQAV